MLRGLINDAKSAAASLVAKYLARASVAVPFVIAVGFAIAAIAHSVIDRFGLVTGCWLLALGFALLGLLAMLFVKHKEQEAEMADKVAESADTAAVASEVAAQVPMALAGALLSTPLGPKALVDLGKALLRNLPLVVLIGLIAVLFWPLEAGGRREETDAGEAHPSPGADGADREKADGFQQDRAA